VPEHTLAVRCGQPRCGLRAGACARRALCNERQSAGGAAAQREHNLIGEQARRAGLQYAYHNHDFEFAEQDGAVGYDLLLRETDPGLVQFEIDCGWMVLGGRDPRDYFARHPGRIPMIHIKDFLPTAAYDSSHAGAELGRGMIDYQPIFAAAEKAGLRHYFAEQEGPFTRMSQIDAARQAYDYLRKLH
jgi:sugar phosphate isomerase/epimerase